MTRWALWLRQLRADAGALAILLALLAGTSFLAVAGPRWLNGVDDEAVRYEVRTARELDDIVASYQAALPPEPGSASRVLAVRDRVLESLDASLADRLQDPLVSASTEAALIAGVNGAPRRSTLPPVEMTLTSLVDPAPQVRYLDGREPAAGEDVPGPFPLLAQYGEPTTVHVVEVALAAVPATAADVVVGDVLTLGGGSPVVVVVTGIFEPVDPAAYLWERQGDLLTDAPVYGVNGIVSNEVTALVPPASFDSLVVALATSPGRAGGLGVEIDYPVDVDLIHAGVVPDLLQAANRAESNPLAAPGGAAVQVTTSLQAPLERYVAQRSTAYAVLAIAAAGLVVSALTVLMLATRLVTDRRRTALALARARGASLRQLVGSSAVEGAAVAVLGAGIGTAVAVVAVTARSSAISWWLLGLLVAATSGVVATVVAVEHRVFARTARRDFVRGRPTPRRVAAEVVVVVLAAGGAVLLRLRGLDAAGAGPDPYLVAVPVLVALATAVLVLRAYPLPLSLLGRAAAGRRGLVSFLGISRAGRESAASAAPVVVLLVGISFAVFASIVLHSVRVEQDVVAWETVGAELRVVGTDFDPDVDVPAIAAAAGVGTADVFGVHVESTATVRGFSEIANFDLLLLDAQAYEDFVAANPVDTGPLDPLVAASAGDGTRVPAVISPALAREVLEGGLGDLPVYLPGTDAVLDTLGIAPAFPGYGPTELWAVARTSDADRVVDLPYWPSILLIDAPHADAAAVLEAARERQPFAQLADRSTVYDEVAGAPLIQATSTAFLLAVVVAAGYCLLAIALALIVAAAPRSRFLSYLRTLGLSDRQARALVGWEVLPPALVATVVGVGVGLLLPQVVLPAVDLRPFTGGLDAPPPLVSGVTVAALAVGLLAVVALAVLVTTSFNRRRQLGGVLRVGEDT